MMDVRFKSGLFAGISIGLLAGTTYFSAISIYRARNDPSSSFTQRLEARFPEYQHINDLTSKEISSIKSQLESDRSENIEANICNLVGVNFDTETEYVDITYRGSGIYLTPNLVLTANHIIDTGPKFFNNMIRVVPAKGDLDLLLEVIATSPRYDLALVRTETSYDNLGTLSIKPGTTRDENFNFYTCEGVNHCSTRMKSLTSNGEREFLDFNYQGELIFPALSFQEFTGLGTSGSPVFQNGNLMGLIVQSVDDSDTIVSNHVYDFLSDVIESSQIEGDEE